MLSGSLGPWELVGIKPLLEFAVTNLSVHVSLLGLAGSLPRSAISLLGISSTRIGTRKLLVGFANSFLDIYGSLFGFQRSDKRNAKSDMGFRETEIVSCLSRISIRRFEQVFGCSDISTRCSLEGYHRTWTAGGGCRLPKSKGIMRQEYRPLITRLQRLQAQKSSLGTKK